MIDHGHKSPAAVADIIAMAAVIWVAAPTLHEGLGHGLACKAMGGEPIAWSTFHFECNHQAMSVWGRRIVAGAGTVVNLALIGLGGLCWRFSTAATVKLAAWIAFVVNGLTSFGYLIFSATFGIGDWNAAGVMAGVLDPWFARGVLAVVGVAGYVAIIWAAARMLSQMLNGPSMAAHARRLAITIWVTTGGVSLLAGLSADAAWQSTLGASIGVALGGNAGLLSIARFMTPSPRQCSSDVPPSWILRGTAIVCVVAFGVVLGPSVRL